MNFRWLLILVVLTTSACTSISGFVGHSSTPTLESIPQPENKLFLLYHHGSLPENTKDPCHPASSFLPGRVPNVIQQLAGTRIGDHEIVVYALCSKVPGRFDAYPESELKVRLRAKEIKDLLKRVHALKIPARQVFLVGHSAGAWASLLVAKDSPELFNAIIGFAPAFAGQTSLRSEQWQAFFEQQRNELTETKSISALLYAFAKDPYYRLEEDLGPLESIDGVTIIWPNNNHCLKGHRAVFRACFPDIASQQIREYLEQRLQRER